MANYPDRDGGGKPRDPVEASREHGLQTITKAFASDLISMEEYERRAGSLQKARSPEEVDLVIADLPAAAPQGRSPAPAPRSAVAPRVDESLSGSQTLACVMGERHLQGDWLNGDRVESFTLMGSTKIDLREVALPGERLKIEAFVLMGETRVIVPRGMAVRLNVFPFMGEAVAKRDVNQRVTPGEPYVLIEGFVMMGSLVVVAQD
jgi:hypothetical protein